MISGAIKHWTIADGCDRLILGVYIIPRTYKDWGPGTEALMCWKLFLGFLGPVSSPLGEPPTLAGISSISQYHPKISFFFQFSTQPSSFPFLSFSFYAPPRKSRERSYCHDSQLTFGWGLEGLGGRLALPVACGSSLGQGWNLCHSCDQSHNSDNAESLTHWTIRERLQLVFNFFFFFLSFCHFLGPLPRHMEVPRLGVESEL